MYAGPQTSFNISPSQFTYARLTLTVSGPDTIILDDLTSKSYCTDALKQYLGLTGEAIPVEILRTDDSECWVRLPRPDLEKFSAAITTFKGKTEGNTQWTLTLKAASDFLGTLTKDGRSLSRTT